MEDDDATLVVVPLPLLERCYAALHTLPYEQVADLIGDLSTVKTLDEYLPDDVPALTS